MRALKFILIPLGVMMVLIGLFLPMAMLILVGCGVMGFPVLVGSSARNLETSYDWGHDEPYDKPTKLDALIEKYMKSDPLDVSATIEFLMEADSLKDPFVEAPMRLDGTPGLPRKPLRKPTTIMDDIASVYAMPSHHMGDHMSEIEYVESMVQNGAWSPNQARRWLDNNGHCELCGYNGTMGGGVCKLCGHHRERLGANQWIITDEDGKQTGGVYHVKRKAMKDAFELQRRDPTRRFILDAYGKRECVAPPARTVDDIREAYGRKRKLPHRDMKGRFCKPPEPVYADYDAYVKEELERKYASIHPMDEPYPIEMSPPAQKWFGSILPSRIISE